jgi:hypothetical protein
MTSAPGLKEMDMIRKLQLVSFASAQKSGAPLGPMVGEAAEYNSA